MYYLTKGLKSKGYTGLGKVLAVVFAIFVIGGSFGGGNMFQVNQAFQLVENITGGDTSFLHDRGWLFGVVMALLVGIVIIGGIKKIAKVTDKIVPFMVLIYVSASLFVLISRYDMIGDAFIQIFNGAFSPMGIAGGAVGVLVSIYMFGISWIFMHKRYVQFIFLFWVSLPYVLAVSIVFIPGQV